MLRAGATSFYSADGLGSVTSLTSAAGALTQTYGYDSFGKQTSSSGSLTNPFQYTARELDAETGLHYYRARYYDPSTGRFISEDPISVEGGPNFYAYVQNNPANLMDPSGLLSVCCRHVKSTGYLACHCFIQFSNGDTFGAYKDGWGLFLRNNYQDDHPVRWPSKCYPLPGSSCVEDKVRKAADNLPRVSGGRVYGFDGSSNTPPAQALRDAGVPFKFPSCAWLSGDPLWNFPLRGLPWSLSGLASR
jgi:RHS repeat-associated protein